MRPRPEVLVATRGHAYDRNAFAEMLSSLSSVGCTQVEQPAAQLHFSPAASRSWDAYLMYDMPGYEFQPDHGPPRLLDPPEVFRKEFLETVERGHGFVFLHHALAAWPTWEEYGDVMGGRFRFVRDEGRPDSGYRHAVRQHISPVSPGHPVLAGLEDGFEIEDELYLAEVADEGIMPLLATDAELTDRTLWSTWNAVVGRRDNNDGWTHPRLGDRCLGTRTPHQPDRLPSVRRPTGGLRQPQLPQAARQRSQLGCRPSTGLGLRVLRG